MEKDTKRGYLSENFRLFHIYDKRSMDFGSHSHEFHKIIICLSGGVTYTVEGKTYFLSPWDILLVPKDKIHHSKTDSIKAYERIVIFIDDNYLKSVSSESEQLYFCFTKADRENRCLIHAKGDSKSRLANALSGLESSAKNTDFAYETLKTSYFLQLMVEFNRLILDESNISSSYKVDSKLEDIISYINANYEKDLSLDRLASKFYLSKSYLMHRFKDVTGGSVHSYITKKRLSAALSLIREGAPVVTAAHDCGFKDYTVFYRSFKKMYGFCPSDMSGK